MKQSVERTKLHIIAFISECSGNLGIITSLGFDLLVVSARAQKEAEPECSKEKKVLAQA